MNSSNLFVKIVLSLGYLAQIEATHMRGISIQASTTPELPGDYETVCSRRPPCPSFRLAHGYSDCNADETPVGMYTMNPECCNDGAETCPHETTVTLTWKKSRIGIVTIAVCNEKSPATKLDPYLLLFALRLSGIANLKYDTSSK